MANTYSQIYIQLVFAVRNRQGLIRASFEEVLYKYITGVVSGQGQKLMAINGMPDHIHILTSISPECRISDLVREIKSESSSWIARERLSPNKFQWQTGMVLSPTVSLRGIVSSSTLRTRRRTTKSNPSNRNICDCYAVLT